MTITNDVKYVGVNDLKIDLFEGQYNVPDGMSYNSYVIQDEKTAVMDTVDAGFTAEWLGNIEAALGGGCPDYLVVHHMEPDHSASITAFKEKYPKAAVVSSAKAFEMMGNFYGNTFEDNRVVVKEGDELSLGKHRLKFIAAPMVHWPEVMVSYDSAEKILFSADAFGKFGAVKEDDDDWACEARRYYFGIVGKYGVQVQALLKKASALDIAIICPLHGPVLKENLGYYINLYDTWSSYKAETPGVLIAYASIYGHTADAAKLLAEKLKERGVQEVDVKDLARCDMSEAVESAFEHDRLVLAASTYNGFVFPYMRDFIYHLTDRGYQKRTVGFIENGSWAPAAARTMAKQLENSKDITYLENTVTIRSALSAESTAKLDALADELAKG